VAGRLRDQSMRAVLTNYKTVNYPVFALYPRARYPSPKVQAFLSFLEERFSTGAWAN